MDNNERKEATNNLIAWSEAKVGKKLSYAWALGYLLQQLTDEQWAKIKEETKKDTLF